MPVDTSAMPMQLTTALDDGVLNFKSMSALEEISRPFEFQIIAVAEDQAIATADLLGTPAAVSLSVDGGAIPRWFHGLVTSVGLEGVEGRQFSYRLTVRPALWLLTRSANLRIFQDKSVPEILQEIFDTYPGNVVNELSVTYNPRPYCVQYRETDFNFVSRLMEEEGIFYYFRHAEDKHELVLADAPANHVVFSTEYRTIKYLEDDNEQLEEAAITEWRFRHEIQTGKITLRDYNFETPANTLEVVAESAPARGHAEGSHEVYDYPGGYAAEQGGESRKTVRLAEMETRYARVSGQATASGLAAGCLFTLEGHPREDQNVEYVVISTQIDMQLAGYEAGVGGDTRFLCRFGAMPSAEPFRPARITRRATVAGPQTAVVVGDGDEGDIVTDEHARVKVQFHWDRLGEKNTASSCWVRVASPMAGNGWGMVSLPRLGQEVVVDFLEGDPDQPLITGRVYNATQKPPYVLPDNATVSTMKSRSKLGAADEFNELRFEDLAGSEYVLLHAQKDRLEFVEETLKAEIGKDEHRTVKENRREKILGDYHFMVVKDVKQKIDGKSSTHIVKAVLVKADDIYSLKVAKDITAESGAAISLKSAQDMHLKIGGNLGADAATNVHIKGGTNIVIEAGTQISIKAGASSIVLGPDGVSITGSMVKINSGGSPGSGAGASPVAPTDPDAPEDPELPEDPLTHR
jgi:type VI secretion system secreted protein VgrG